MQYMFLYRNVGGLFVWSKYSGLLSIKLSIKIGHRSVLNVYRYSNAENILNKKQNAASINSLIFLHNSTIGCSKIIPFTGGTILFPVLLLSLLLTISEIPDMYYVTFMKLTQNGTFSLVGFNLNTHVNVCNHLLVWHCRNTSSKTKKE